MSSVAGGDNIPSDAIIQQLLQKHDIFEIGITLTALSANVAPLLLIYERAEQTQEFAFLSQVEPDAK